MSDDYTNFVERMGSFEDDFDTLVDGVNSSSFGGDELKHYGVLGMKWGVRRYQNKDGTRTPAGKKQRTVQAKKLAREQEKSIRKRDKEILKERKETSKNRRLLSDEELLKAVGRLKTERQLRDLTKEDRARGETETSRILLQIGRTSATAAGIAMATYTVKAALEGKWDPKDAAKFIKPRK